MKKSDVLSEVDLNLDNPKTIKSWALYDWANSAYSLIITSAIFPIYYSSVVPENVEFFGRNFQRSSLAFISISISYVIISFLSPMLSGIADSRGNKKSFLKFYYSMGSLACVALFFFKPNLGKYYILFGLVLSTIASVGYSGSIVFYNAFLPEIASKGKQDSVSAKGFAWGYVGSVLLLLGCLFFILTWKDSDLPARISFLAVGLWWFVFAQISLRGLPDSPSSKEKLRLAEGFKELKIVWGQLKEQPILKKYLTSFFFFNMGVQTIMYLATYFASDELAMESQELIITILIIQLVAILGAWGFAKISKSYGNFNTLLLIISVWVGICFAAYFVQTVLQFFALAFAVGLVMGGVQSMSRSTYSKLLPKTKDTSSYFSFMDVCFNVGIVIGTATFTIVSELAGGMRNSALALSTYFIIGGLLLFLLKRNSNEDLFD